MNAAIKELGVDWQMTFPLLRSRLVVRCGVRILGFLACLLWPRIDCGRKARLAADCGAIGCLLIGGEWPFRHFAWPAQMPFEAVGIIYPAGLIVSGAWLGLACAIEGRSLVAAAAALGLYLGMRIESVVCLVSQRANISLFEIVVSALFTVLLLNSMRGVAILRRGPL